MVGNTITPILNQKKYNVMAKLLYNVRAYSDTADNWAANTHIYPPNSLLIATDTGAIKRGDGVNAYAQLASLGVKQVAKVADITNWPATFPPAAHDHAVVADAESGLEAAATIQDLAKALSARILALETPAGGEGGEEG